MHATHLSPLGDSLNGQWASLNTVFQIKEISPENKYNSMLKIFLGAFQTVARCLEEQAPGAGTTVARRTCLSPRDAPDAAQSPRSGRPVKARTAQPTGVRQGLLALPSLTWGPAGGRRGKVNRPSAPGLRPAPSPSPWLRASRCGAPALSPFSRELGDSSLPGDVSLPDVPPRHQPLPGLCLTSGFPARPPGSGLGVPGAAPCGERW